MNDNNMNYSQREDYETEIDLLNLLGHLLIKWRQILVVGIVCAIIGGLIGFARSGESDTTKTLGREEMISVAAERLSEAQRAEAEKYYEQMVKYDQVIEEQKVLYDESYFMNLDPYTAVGCGIWYMLETDLGNASSIYSETLNDDDYRKIADVLGTDIKTRYLKEIVTFWWDETVDSYKFNLTNTDTQVGDIRNGYKVLFKVTITAPDSDARDKIAQIVDEAVKRETDALSQYGATIKCTKFASRTFDTNMIERVIEAQQVRINTQVNLETNRANFYNNVVSKVSADEKTYFDALYMSRPNESPEEAPEDVKVNKVSWRKILKYGIVVAFAGVALLVCLIAAIYLFGGKLHVADEVNSLGIPVLQALTAGKHDKSLSDRDIFSKWGSKLMGVNGDDVDSFSILMEELEKKTENEINTTYIAVDRSSMEALEYAQKISNGSKGNVTYYIGSIVPDAEDMKQLLGSDSVLVLPVIEVTNTKSIATLANICTRNRIRIIGSAPVMTGAR